MSDMAASVAQDASRVILEGSSCEVKDLRSEVAALTAVCHRLSRTSASPKFAAGSSAASCTQSHIRECESLGSQSPGGAGQAPLSPISRSGSVDLPGSEQMFDVFGATSSSGQADAQSLLRPRPQHQSRFPPSGDPGAKAPHPDLAAAEADGAEARAELRRLRAELQRSEELRQLAEAAQKEQAQQLAQANQALHNKEKQHAKVVEALALLEKLLKDKTSEIAELQDVQERTKLALKEQEDEALRLTRQIAELMTEQERLKCNFARSDLAAGGVGADDCRTLRERCSKAQQDRLDAQRRLSEADAALGDMQQDLAMKTKALKESHSQVEMFQAAVHALQLKYEELEQKHTSQTCELQQAVSKKHLPTAVDLSHHEVVVAELQAQVVAEKARSTQALQGMRALELQLSHAQVEMEGLQKSVASLSQSEQNAHQQRLHQEMQWMQAKRTIEELQMSVSAAEASRNSAQQKQKLVEAEASALQGELDELQRSDTAKHEKLRGEIRRMQALVADAEQQNCDLVSRLHSEKKRVSESEIQRGDVEAELEATQRRLQAAEEVNQRLQTAAGDRAEAEAGIRQSLVQEQRASQELAEQLKSAQAEMLILAQKAKLQSDVRASKSLSLQINDLQHRASIVSVSGDVQASWAASTTGLAGGNTTPGGHHLVAVDLMDSGHAPVNLMDSDTESTQSGSGTSQHNRERPVTLSSTMEASESM